MSIDSCAIALHADINLSIQKMKHLGDMTLGSHTVSNTSLHPKLISYQNQNNNVMNHKKGYLNFDQETPIIFFIIKLAYTCNELVATLWRSSTQRCISLLGQSCRGRKVEISRLSVDGYASASLMQVNGSIPAHNAVCVIANIPHLILLPDGEQLHASAQILSRDSV